VRLSIALVVTLGMIAAHLGALVHLASHEHVLVPGTSRLVHATGLPLAPASGPSKRADTADDCVFVAVLAQASIVPALAPVQPAVLSGCDPAVQPPRSLLRTSAVELLLLAPSHSPPCAS